MKLLKDVDTRVKLYEFTLSELIEKLGLGSQGDIESMTIINAQTQRDLGFLEHQRLLVRVGWFTGERSMTGKKGSA